MLNRRMDCRIKSGSDDVINVIARSVSDEAIQGRLALNAGVLRYRSG
jgi:hypothetical protein